MHRTQRLLHLTAQLQQPEGLTVADLDDLQLLATCGLPIEARRGRYRLAPLKVGGKDLNLEETLGVTLALMLTTGPKRRLKASYDRVVARARRTGTGPS